VGKFDAVVAINENKPILDFDVEKFVVRWRIQNEILKLWVFSFISFLEFESEFKTRIGPLVKIHLWWYPLVEEKVFKMSRCASLHSQAIQLQHTLD